MHVSLAISHESDVEYTLLYFEPSIFTSGTDLILLLILLLLLELKSLGSIVFNWIHVGSNVTLLCWLVSV